LHDWWTVAASWQQTSSFNTRTEAHRDVSSGHRIESAWETVATVITWPKAPTPWANHYYVTIHGLWKPKWNCATSL